MNLLKNIFYITGWILYKEVTYCIKCKYLFINENKDYTKDSIFTLTKSNVSPANPTQQLLDIVTSANEFFDQLSRDCLIGNVIDERIILNLYLKNNNCAEIIKLNLCHNYCTRILKCFFKIKLYSLAKEINREIYLN